MNTLTNAGIAAVVDTMTTKLTELGIVPGSYILSGGRHFIVNDNQTVTPVDVVPDNAHIVDLKNEVIFPNLTESKKKVRYRSHPRAKAVKPYVNNKPCKRKAKKK